MTADKSPLSVPVPGATEEAIIVKLHHELNDLLALFWRDTDGLTARDSCMDALALRPDLPLTGTFCNAVRAIASTRKLSSPSPELETTREPGDNLALLRGAGWQVAVHNDYRQDGKLQTFWLLTHPDGRFVKGEGDTDEVALAECAKAVSRPPVEQGSTEK